MVSIPLRGKVNCDSIILAVVLAAANVSIPLRGKVNCDLSEGWLRIVDASCLVSIPLRGKVNCDFTAAIVAQQATSFNPLAGKSELRLNKEMRQLEGKN